MAFFTLCIPFLPFAAASVFHLVCCFAGWQTCRAVSKAFLMPLLLGGYLFGAAAPMWLIAAGLAFGFLGDVFLLLPGKDWAFLAGLGSFLLGHICYIAAFAQRLTAWPPAITLVILGLVLAAVGVCAFWSLKSLLGKMTIPAALYLLVIVTMAFFAISYAISQPSPLALAAIPGGLLFLCSDYLLAHRVFGKDNRRGNFWIMLTYLLAQAGIVISVMA